MLSEQQVDEFDGDGFLNAGPVLDEALLARLTEELDRILEKGPDGFAEREPQPVLFRDLAAGGYDGEDGGSGPTPVWQIVNIWEASPLFEGLIRHPFVVKASSQLTGFDSLQVWHDQVQYKPPLVGGATGWHQDAPLWPSIEPMTPVSAWIPFDDADESNGCMWMVPGSHKWGNQMDVLGTQHHLKTLAEFADVAPDFVPPPDAPVREVAAVCRPVRRGEVHFHHSLTWHGSPMNRSERPRRAIAIHYMTGEARYTGRAHCMQPFITIDVGQPMSGAGPHFPVVCRDGEPVPRGN
ncbi:MAG: phytanoyl-CoA dioxygenase family protein [Verrucomicrobia bacterium]|nr:phytanoyl-CoA dioxygenase family protein [Verrucomicrobiota bacterium]